MVVPAVLAVVLAGRDDAVMWWRWTEATWAVLPIPAGKDVGVGPCRWKSCPSMSVPVVMTPVGVVLPSWRYHCGVSASRFLSPGLFSPSESLGSDPE